jgi:hypothetical protein
MFEPLVVQLLQVLRYLCLGCIEGVGQVQGGWEALGSQVKLHQRGFNLQNILARYILLNILGINWKSFFGGLRHTLPVLLALELLFYG